MSSTFAPAHLLVFGYSFGSGPTVDLAARRKVGGVVLDSAYMSPTRVLTRVKVLPFDHFDNLSKLPHVSSPILFIHHKDDRVIAFWHGEALYPGCAWTETVPMGRARWA